MDWCFFPCFSPISTANKRIALQDLLPGYIEKAGCKNVEETRYFNTLFGTVKLIKAIKDE